MNVPACVETGLWTLHTLDALGRAWKQGPGRFGHVNVPRGAPGRASSRLSWLSRLGLGAALERGRWARWARRPGSVSQCCASVSVRDGSRHGRPRGVSRSRRPTGRQTGDREGSRGRTDRRAGRRERTRTGAGAQAGPAMARTPGGSTYASVSSVSGRMASGIWPYGLWSLAVWPLDSRRMALPHFTR